MTLRVLFGLIFFFHEIINISNENEHKSIILKTSQNTTKINRIQRVSKERCLSLSNANKKCSYSEKKDKKKKMKRKRTGRNKQSLEIRGKQEGNGQSDDDTKK